MTEAKRFRVVVAQRTGHPQLADALAGDPACEVAATTTHGDRAVTLARRLQPDAIVLDAELPDEAAFEATRQIMAETPTPIIIFVADGERGAQDRLAALRAGAILVVHNLAELIAAVRALAPLKLERRVRPAPTGTETAAPADHQTTVVAIAASTGGPAACARILSELPGDFAAPILLTQHISEGFVDGMVRWLDSVSPMHVKIAEHGERIAPSTVYVAADNRHLIAGADRTLTLSDAPRTDGHRPSATIMYNSVAASFGGAALGAILTGMGHDGTAGLTAIHNAGGTVIAQDEATSVVFGMPRSAIEAGVVDTVLPLDRIAGHLVRAVSRSHSHG